MRSLRILVALIVLLAAAAAAVVYSGVYDVSAAAPEEPWVARLLDTAKDRAIEKRVAEMPPPPSLTDPSQVTEGQLDFAEMCVTCHGAPGVPKSEIGMGLNPDAPDLKDEARDSSPQHLFWVIKNGIKMTGMPAFGLTHSDAKIWSMVAFLKQLPQMDAAQYAASLKAASPASPPAPTPVSPPAATPPASPSSAPPPG
jgi:mono/diheme cytochrome c family protein